MYLINYLILSEKRQLASPAMLCNRCWAGKRGRTEQREGGSGNSRRNRGGRGRQIEKTTHFRIYSTMLKWKSSWLKKWCLPLICVAAVKLKVNVLFTALPWG